MSKAIENGADILYDRHLQGTPFRRKPQADEQALMERMWLRVLTELSVNRFKWINLPEEIDPRFVETTLFYNGFGLFFRDFRFSRHMFTKATSQGRLDMYDNPTRFRAIGVNYPSVDVSVRKPSLLTGKGIPIWSNYLRMPDLDIARIYSGRLARADRTIDINMDNARMNKFIMSSERARLSMDNISREVEQGNNNIKVSKSVLPGDLDAIKVLDLGIEPEKIERLHIIRTRHFNDACTLLGIDNSNQDKKERLVAAEVGANDDQTLMMRYVNLNARQQACAAINEAYGLDIWVEYNTMIDEMITIPDFAEAGLEGEGYQVMEPVDESQNAEKEENENERDYDAAEASD